MTDQLERRLTNVLTEASAHADPVAARLRNPAVTPRREPARRRAGWAVVATGVAVAVGLVVGIPSMSSDPKPADPPPAGPPLRGQPDGRHPLWTLGVTERYASTFDQLGPAQPAVTPTPHTVDTTLVTAAGPVRFAGATGVHLIAERAAGVFVAVTRGGGGDGLHDVDFQLVAADNTRRTVGHAARAGSVAVSPDGTLLAFSTWLGGGGEAAVQLVDVASGRLVHRLAGRFTQVDWASDSTLVLAGDPAGPTSLAWRAPWTGPGEPIPVRAGTAFTVAGGMVALDRATGCLQRLDGAATVTAANCHGWTSAGNVSPDGRLVSLEWASGSTTQYGVLDLARNQVRSWPVPGLNPVWLGPADVLLTEADAADTPRTARCDLTRDTCVRMMDD